MKRNQQNPHIQDHSGGVQNNAEYMDIQGSTADSNYGSNFHPGITGGRMTQIDASRYGYLPSTQPKAPYMFNNANNIGAPNSPMGGNSMPGAAMGMVPPGMVNSTGLSNMGSYGDEKTALRNFQVFCFKHLYRDNPDPQVVQMILNTLQSDPSLIHKLHVNIRERLPFVASRVANYRGPPAANIPSPSRINQEYMHRRTSSGFMSQQTPPHRSHISGGSRHQDPVDLSSMSQQPIDRRNLDQMAGSQSLIRPPGLETHDRNLAEQVLNERKRFLGVWANTISNRLADVVYIDAAPNVKGCLPYDIPQQDGKIAIQKSLLSSPLLAGLAVRHMNDAPPASGVVNTSPTGSPAYESRPFGVPPASQQATSPGQPMASNMNNAGYTWKRGVSIDDVERKQSDSDRNVNENMTDDEYIKVTIMQDLELYRQHLAVAEPNIDMVNRLIKKILSLGGLSAIAFTMNVVSKRPNHQAFHGHLVRLYNRSAGGNNERNIGPSQEFNPQGAVSLLVEMSKRSNILDENIFSLLKGMEQGISALANPNADRFAMGRNIQQLNSSIQQALVFTARKFENYALCRNLIEKAELGQGHPMGAGMAPSAGPIAQGNMPQQIPPQMAQQQMAQQQMVQQQMAQQQMAQQQMAQQQMAQQQMAQQQMSVEEGGGFTRDMISTAPMNFWVLLWPEMLTNIPAQYENELQSDMQRLARLHSSLDASEYEMQLRMALVKWVSVLSSMNAPGTQMMIHKAMEFWRGSKVDTPPARCVGRLMIVNPTVPIWYYKTSTHGINGPFTPQKILEWDTRGHIAEDALLALCLESPNRGKPEVDTSRWMSTGDWKAASLREMGINFNIDIGYHILPLHVLSREEIVLFSNFVQEMRNISLENLNVGGGYETTINWKSGQGLEPVGSVAATETAEDIHQKDGAPNVTEPKMVDKDSNKDCVDNPSREDADEVNACEEIPKPSNTGDEETGPMWKSGELINAIIKNTGGSENISGNASDSGKVGNQSQTAVYDMESRHSEKGNNSVSSSMGQNIIRNNSETDITPPEGKKEREGWFVVTRKRGGKR